ncbi:Ctr copper transporter family protein [Nitzschia inconspicua]|uniref:Ctr copper transporter family protein n=1 Tax=Nitzschia inconspicua TaxID=303405 RepID=A0A9K3K817_9STRA|nr:Ctr copper transporter family protein [Nitzschia inconspicua]KAG7342774.1 Ctr copper transporter family protein [Nitzschia inconspicua]
MSRVAVWHLASSVWMSVFVLVISWSAALVSSSSPIFKNSGHDDNHIPTFTIQDLRERQRQVELKQTLSSTGILAVRLEDLNQQHYAQNRHAALQGLCECHDHPNFLQLEQTRSLLLQDDATHRISVGTATVGMSHPLPLPNDLEAVCGPQTLDAMEGLRDAVASVSEAFVSALGDLIEEYTHASVPLLQDKHGGKRYDTLSSIVQSANHLEHFHVYSKEMSRNDSHQDSKDETMAPWEWHTDAGLFLVFVPAMNCLQENAQDSSFWYRNAQGDPIQARFDGSTTAIVMLGQGAEDWLNLAAAPDYVGGDSKLRLKATVHSVRWDSPTPFSQGRSPSSSLYQQQRSWYGMMYLVPETAMIHGIRTLKDVRSSLSWSSMGNNEILLEKDSIVLGCGVAEPTNYDDYQQQLLSEDGWGNDKRRRMQHQDPSACNNVTNFFCWMQCLEIPNANQAQGYVNEGYSLYCLDPAVLASSSRVSDAAAPCEAGWVHNANCLGSWEPTAPGVPAATVNVTADISDLEQPFCYSGTTMYMDGFHLIQSTTCVIFLFQSWVLDTGGKYTLAFLGTVMSGIFLERLIQQRRKFMGTMAAGHKRLLYSAIFYGIQLTIGYMLMLVIMIYSGALFISTVLGLVLGHVFFNAQDAIWPLKMRATTFVIPAHNSDDASYLEEATERQEQTPVQEVSHERSVELSTELTTQAARMNHEKEWLGDEEQDTCCGKGQGDAIVMDPGDPLIPEGSTPCCQYSSCD